MEPVAWSNTTTHMSSLDEAALFRQGDPGLTIRRAGNVQGVNRFSAGGSGGQPESPVAEARWFCRSKLAAASPLPVTKFAISIWRSHPASSPAAS